MTEPGERECVCGVVKISCDLCNVPISVLNYDSLEFSDYNEIEVKGKKITLLFDRAHYSLIIRRNRFNSKDEPNSLSENNSNETK